MQHSPLNPPLELLAALDLVASGIAAVRTQMDSLQAAESFLLHTGDMLAQQIAVTNAGRKPTDSALNMAYRTVQTEIGAAIHESDRTVALKMGRATELVEKYPAVYSALARGKVSVAHTNAIVDAGAIIEEGKARANYAAEALDFAEAESVSRLRPVAKQLAERHSGEKREERYERARALRRVFVIERDDGMADLTAHMPAPYAYGIKDRLDQMARTALDARHRAKKQAAESKKNAVNHANDDDVRAGDGLTSDVHTGDDVGDEVNPVDNRTADQLRADLLTDMLLASNFEYLRTNGAPASNLNARVQVIIPVHRIKAAAVNAVNGRAVRGNVSRQQRPIQEPPQGTVGLFDGLVEDRGPAYDGLSFDSAEVDDKRRAEAPTDAATLEGYGPISDRDALEITALASCWETVSVDAETGTVLTVDTYRPSAAQRRFLGARDLHCRFPGCRASLAWCDIDHTIDAALGGSTSIENLGAVCRRHHTLKHATPWTVTQDDRGVFTWVSPTGRIYTDSPESNVRFRTSDEAEGTAAPSFSFSGPGGFGAGFDTPARTKARGSGNSGGADSSGESGSGSCYGGSTDASDQSSIDPSVTDPADPTDYTGQLPF